MNLFVTEILQAGAEVNKGKKASLHKEYVSPS